MDGAAWNGAHNTDRKLERAVWAVVRENPYLNRYELAPLVLDAWRTRGLGEPGVDIPHGPGRILQRLVDRGELTALVATARCFEAGARRRIPLRDRTVLARDADGDRQILIDRCPLVQLDRLEVEPGRACWSWPTRRSGHARGPRAAG